MAAYIFEGRVVAGTDAEIFNKIVAGFWHEPSTKKLFKIASAVTGRTIHTPTEYITALVALGQLKEVGAVRLVRRIRLGLVKYDASRFSGSSRSFAGQGRCSSGDNGSAVYMNETATRAYCLECATVTEEN